MSLFNIEIYLKKCHFHKRLSLSHDEVVHQKGSLLEKMPGTEDKKFANLRAAYGFFMTHPGKKLLFMGQEYGQVHEWAENKALDWEDLEKPAHRQMQNYTKALIQLYNCLLYTSEDLAKKEK